MVAASSSIQADAGCFASPKGSTLIEIEAPSKFAGGGGAATTDPCGGIDDIPRAIAPEKTAIAAVATTGNSWFGSVPTPNNAVFKVAVAAVKVPGTIGGAIVLT